MLILGIDSSATSASAALTDDGKLVAESFLNVGLTHSKTLMVLVDEVMKNGNKKIEDLDLIAVANGPGSFTGIRIGVALVKGLASAYDTPCIGLSTLEEIAYPFAFSDFTVVSCMDARCSQVYTACFENGIRKTEDEALTIDELGERINSGEYGEKIILAGDGAKIAYDILGDNEKIWLAPPQNRFQRASSLCFIAENYMLNTDVTPKNAMFVNPVYLRKPQAERMKELNSNRKD